MHGANEITLTPAIEHRAKAGKLEKEDCPGRPLFRAFHRVDFDDNHQLLLSVLAKNRSGSIYRWLTQRQRNNLYAIDAVRTSSHHNCCRVGFNYYFSICYI